jgi:hypothetical protein
MHSENTKLIGLIPTKYSHLFNVQLNLSFQTRYIGKIDFAGDGTFTTNRKSKHIFKKLNALGVNHSLLIDESIHFKWIVIEYEGRKLVTSRHYFLTHGKCYQFGKVGFELQCFLPLDKFGLNEAREFEANQMTLFSEVS